MKRERKVYNDDKAHEEERERERTQSMHPARFFRREQQGERRKGGGYMGLKEKTNGRAYVPSRIKGFSIAISYLLSFP